MASEPRRTPPAMADIGAARRRSAQYGLDPATSEVPHVGDPGPAADALRQLSAPVLDELLSQIADSSLAVALADRDGRLTRRGAPTSATLAAMDTRCLDVGFSLAEPDVGTNGVGTSLETRRPTVVVGGDHYLESFQAFTCVNAPIIGPITNRVEGTVGVLCPSDETSPLLLPTALRLASQISDLLLEQATPEERFLLDEFLRGRRSRRTAVATIGPGVLIATPAAQRRLSGVDHAELWAHVEALLRDGAAAHLDFDRTASTPLRLRCRPLHRGGALEGATVEFVSDAQPGRRTRRMQQRKSLGDLVGASRSWHELVADAIEVASLEEPVLVVGERGSGRRSVATAIARHRDGRDPTVLDSAEILIDGVHDWLVTAREALSSPVRQSPSTVILRRIDELPDDAAAALAAICANSVHTRIIATAQAVDTAEPGLSALNDQLNVFRLDVPPLRDRRKDIRALAHHFAAELGGSTVSDEVMGVLLRQPWAGNATELRQALRSAYARARGGPLTVQHLPRHLRQERYRTPLHGLRAQEADAILAAINSASTRAEAADMLGISRATLFRRINAYGLNVEET